MRAQFRINLLELGVDANRNERVSYDELDARIENVFALIKRHFVLGAPGAPTRVVLERQQIVEDHVLQADLLFHFDRPIRELRVESTLDTVTTAGHIHFVRTTIGGENLQALLTPQSRTVSFLVGGITIRRVVAVAFALVGIAALIALRMLGRVARQGPARVSGKP